MKTFSLVRCISENKFFCFNLVEKNNVFFEQKSLKPEYYYLKNEFIDFEKRLQAFEILGIPEIIEVSDIENNNIYSIRKKVDGKSLSDLVNEKKSSVEDFLFRLIDIVNFLRDLEGENLGIENLRYEDIFFTDTGEMGVRNLIPEAFFNDSDVRNNVENLISYTMFGYIQDSINYKLTVITDPVLEEIQRLLEQLKSGDIEDRRLDYICDYLAELVYNNGLTIEKNMPERTPVIDFYDNNKESDKKEGSSNLIIFGIIVLVLIIIGYNIYNHLKGQESLVKTPKSVNSIVKIKSEFIKPEMIFVKGGSFMMGSDKSENKDEKPAHEVVVRDYYMGKYEVTVAEFKFFVKDQDYVTEIEKVGVTWGFVKGQIDLATGYSWLNTGFKQSGKRPVVCINWYDALEYCNWLSRQEGLVEYYKIDRKKRDKNNIGGFDTKKWTVVVNRKSDGYRLPTESEWEFAARARGKDVKWSECNDRSLIPQYGNIADSSSGLTVTEKDLNDGIEFTAKVGSFKPNSLGLYDMTGNVWEMCWDWYFPAYYKAKVKKNPQGSFNGLNRVIRGGGWDYGVEHATTSNRNSISPIHGSCTVGFRLVRSFKK
ncbi:formylglycine-generating enzyme family protein [bacterium]|nr:formylglycine-generating enzyme family protein [bacterium]